MERFPWEHQHRVGQRKDSARDAAQQHLFHNLQADRAHARHSKPELG